jgi:uncharacterized phage protein (TIGR01671 family)
MREIKFRGWNKSAAHPYMLDIEQVTYDESGKLSCISGFPIDSDNGGEITLLDGQFEIMQFTGLQDKNGVDIFEGDIVSMHTEYIESYPYHNDGADDFNVQRIGEVRIHASKGAVITKPLNVCNETGDKNRHKWNVQLSAYRTIVIGNIHQSPELLEK